MYGYPLTNLHCADIWKIVRYTCSGSYHHMGLVSKIALFTPCLPYTVYFCGQRVWLSGRVLTSET